MSRVCHSPILYATHYWKLIPVVLRSEGWVCSRWISAIATSNPAESMDARLCLCCVELIANSEESYRVCVCVCDLKTLTMKRPRLDVGCCVTAKETKQAIYV